MLQVACLDKIMKNSLKNMLRFFKKIMKKQPKNRVERVDMLSRTLISQKIFRNNLIHLLILSCWKMVNITINY
jgi:hypothetical protein